MELLTMVSLVVTVVAALGGMIITAFKVAIISPLSKEISQATKANENTNKLIENISGELTKIREHQTVQELKIATLETHIEYLRNKGADRMLGTTGGL